MEFVLNSLPLKEDQRIELLNLLYEDRRETVDKLTSLIVKNLRLSEKNLTTGKEEKIDVFTVSPDDGNFYHEIEVTPDVESVLTSKELYINDLDLE